MASHFFLMMLFSCFVSVVFAALMREKPEDQIRLGARLFAAFVLAGVALGWLRYPFPL